MSGLGFSPVIVRNQAWLHSCITAARTRSLNPLVSAGICWTLWIACVQPWSNPATTTNEIDCRQATVAKANMQSLQRLKKLM